MPSSNHKKQASKAGKPAAGSISPDLDRQLQLISEEISGHMSRLAARLAGAATVNDISHGREREAVLRLVQDILFYSMAYARNISSAISLEDKGMAADRLLELFSRCFYREFFLHQDRPGAYEYFDAIFRQDYSCFMDEMKQRGFLSLSPSEFISKSMEEIMASPPMAEILGHKAHSDLRDQVPRLIESQAFARISQALLSS